MSTGKKKYCMASFMLAIVTLTIVALTICLVYSTPEQVYAVSQDGIGSFDSARGEEEETPNYSDGLWISWPNEEGGISAPIRMLIVLTVLSLAPAILIMLTSFTRIIIVLHFVRTALGTQSSPPNQVLVGLSLFLTAFIMAPTFSEVNENALKPLDRGEITLEAAIKEAEGPFREFMYPKTMEKDVNMFCEIAGVTYESTEDIPMTVLIPSFVIGELRRAFIIGFIIYIPFIVIDMVVSSVLMSMGMMMLPPTTISMPFKILLFVLADGWNLVIGELVKTFF
ncbi:MAG: flagellar type III secretion system pore protein FliP [Eubacterium sp.]|nr:flagellar type III secretion system pore protein FliP [Eubacterium sp.]